MVLSRAFGPGIGGLRNPCDEASKQSGVHQKRFVTFRLRLKVVPVLTGSVWLGHFFMRL
jgi:hypothetical protein